MIYRYAYKCGNQDNKTGHILRVLLRISSGNRVQIEADPDSQKIKVAIIVVGVGLAEDMLGNPKTKYVLRCFVDSSSEKVGRAMTGAEEIEIVETVLRPGEKLYEWLLVKNEELEKTENDLIFIEHEDLVSMDEIEDRFKMLKSACEEDDDNDVREAMGIAVPTFRRPEEVNRMADQKVG
ncbi:MAG: polysaccharide biosynthesis protein [Lachnospiraceae bacterium]|nr:polysaccharide biosynthesis protein [Lachnospiraceae bacterium]